MFRSIFRFVLTFPVMLLGLTVFAQQNVPPAQNSTPSTPPAASATQQTTGQTEALPDDPGTTAHVAAPLAPDGPTAVLDTTMGRMICGLYAKEAPATVANFVGLATGTKEWTDPTTHKKVQGRSLYAGTTFHRVIPGFMIQGGDPLGTGAGDAGYYFNDEIVPDLNFDVAGRLAMANAGPNTNGSQFFITVAPQPSLDQHYSIFGQCDAASVLVAESITEVPRDSRDKPEDPVTINKITIVQPGEPMPPAPAATPATSPPAAAQP